MAYDMMNIDISLEAAADLSAKQYYAVKVDSNGLAALAGAGEAAIGILQNKPTAGQTAVVRVGGVSKIFCAGVIAPGAVIASDANGKLTTATKGKTDTSDTGGAADALIGSNVLGVHLGTANSAANDISSALIIHMGAVPTTAA